MRKNLFKFIIFIVSFLSVACDLIYAAACSEPKESFSGWGIEEREDHTKRYFNVSSANGDIEQQFKEQMLDHLYAGKTYLETQRDFLRHVLVKKEETGALFAGIDKIFERKKRKKESVEESERKLMARITSYSVYCDEESQYLAGLIADWERGSDSRTFGERFISTVKMREDKLMDWGRRRKILNLPSTKPEDYSGLDSFGRVLVNIIINAFRIFDEYIYKIYPYIEVEDLDRANTAENYIAKDYSLMRFLLLGHYDADIYVDPDTRLKMWSDAVLDLGSEKILRLENEEKYKKFRKCLSDLKKKVSVTRNKKEAEVPTVPLTSDEKHEASDMAVPSRIKPVAVVRSKQPVPQGGWSTKDRERSTAAASRLSNFKVLLTAGAGSDSDGDAYRFTPASPINLSHANYETLQIILDPTTPEFSLSFNQVAYLLDEGLGITVTRSSGSHAHLDTPGRNMKILVDLHGGWTDKFNGDTMKDLRQLMVNLGLDKPENVIRGEITAKA